MISNALTFEVVYERREDGGVRAYSPDLMGLHLSSGPAHSPAKVAEIVEAASQWLVTMRLNDGKPPLGKGKS